MEEKIRDIRGENPGLARLGVNQKINQNTGKTVILGLRCPNQTS
jgi:hypothetical protein